MGVTYVTYPYSLIANSMTTLFVEDEEESDELLSWEIFDPENEEDMVDESDEEDWDETEKEITLDDIKELEEEENIWHKVQTYDPALDGTDNYFDERYFDE